jgi:ectoine hydroxylase-related dioxygenase (phytanoyl-CoA dioxygenase family)
MSADLERAEREFLERGYAVIPADHVAPLLPGALAAFDRLIERAEALGLEGRTKVRKSDFAVAEGRGWSWGCDHIYHPDLREQALLDLVSLRPFPEAVRRILGERVMFSGGHGHWSPVTSDYVLHWHRDTRRHLWHRHNPDPRAHVQLCLALVEEAVVRVVPGSHLRDLEPWEERFLGPDPHADHPSQQIASVPAGCALLLNTYTFHRAECPRTSKRRSLHFGFTRVGAAPEPGRQLKALPWMGDEGFITRQSPFLQAAIREQLAAVAAQALREGGDAAG